jgi:hypothetical protein
MSLSFNDTTNKKGIIQTIERILSLGDAFISGNTARLKEFTAEINLALDRAFAIIFGADGTWQFDDSGHTDYPIITTNLVSGQRDYSFTTDEGGNLILDIFKVLVQLSGDNAPFIEVFPVDVQSERESTQGFWNGLNVEAIPLYYDKTANAIFFDPIPSYDKTDGIKIYISREGSYFLTTDTTKKPGFAGLYHEYLAYRPAYQFAVRNNLAIAPALRAEMLQLETDIEHHYARRERDKRSVLKMAYKEYR